MIGLVCRNDELSLLSLAAVSSLVDNAHELARITKVDFSKLNQVISLTCGDEDIFKGLLRILLSSQQEKGPLLKPLCRALTHLKTLPFAHEAHRAEKIAMFL